MGVHAGLTYDSSAGAEGELEAMSVNDDGLGPDDFRSEGWVRY